MGGTGGASNVQPILHMNAASLQQQKGYMGLEDAQQMQQPTGQIDQFHGMNQCQLQNMGPSSILSMLARSDMQPQSAASNMSAQLMHKQKVIVDVKHQVHSQNGGGYVGIHTSSARSTVPSKHDQSLLGSSLSGQQRQAQLQQPGNSMPYILGDMAD
jgi:hypothetical protein